MKNISLKKTFEQYKWKSNSVICITIFVSILGNTSVYCEKQDNDVCQTSGCRSQAKRLQSFMNLKADPCNDFYEFTCGNFVKRTKIPDDKSAVTMFSIVQNDLQLELKSLIEQPITKDEPRHSVLVKKYYRACMNQKRIENRGLQPVLKILNIVTGGWPVLYPSSWKGKHFDWILATHLSAKIGSIQSAFLRMVISADARNSTRRLITFAPASLGLAREYLVATSDKDVKIINAYFTYMVNVAVLFGADRRIARKELKEALIFEMTLAKISLAKSERRNATKIYNPMTVRKLQAKYPSINWLRYINGILQPLERLDHDETVIVEEPYYMKEFEKLVKSTSKRTLANHMSWRIIAQLAQFLDSDIRAEQFRFKAVLKGTTKRPPRWEECIGLVKGLNLAVGAMYVQNYFDKASKTNMLELVKNIREQFKITLKELDWMDEQTKRRALDKASTIFQFIAYPNELLDNKLIDAYHDELELNDQYFLESRLNITLFESDYTIKQLHEPIDKKDWKAFSAADVNAYYTRKRNMIQFPAGILKGVFFDNDRPNYMNFGGIGTVIGHEITHGFDDQGRQFNKDGNLVQWWKSETKEAFLKEAKCIIDQYASYTVPEINNHPLNGVTSQGENIADNGGMKQAYYAYKQWVRKHGKEPKLPGLPYTPEQMFWISTATLWCNKMRPEALKSRVITGVHVPGKYRVLGPFSNLKEFSKDFECPVGSPMNPKKKCQVW